MRYKWEAGSVLSLFLAVGALSFGNTSGASRDWENKASAQFGPVVVECTGAAGQVKRFVPASPEEARNALARSGCRAVFNPMF